MMAIRFSREVICDHCGKKHVAEYSHDGVFGEGPIYAVVCEQDGLTDYYRESALIKEGS